jgi:hypothetical protein
MLSSSKPALLAAVVSLALPSSFFSTAALAHTYERCDPDGDHCVRVTCDRDGDECWRKSEHYKNRMYREKGRWVCDSDGDRCHYEYTGRKWEPHWDRDDHDHDR